MPSWQRWRKDVLPDNGAVVVAAHGDAKLGAGSVARELRGEGHVGDVARVALEGLARGGALDQARVRAAERNGANGQGPSGRKGHTRPRTIEKQMAGAFTWC